MSSQHIVGPNITFRTVKIMALTHLTVVLNLGSVYEIMLVPQYHFFICISVSEVDFKIEICGDTGVTVTM